MGEVGDALRLFRMPVTVGDLLSSRRVICVGVDVESDVIKVLSCVCAGMLPTDG